MAVDQITALATEVAVCLDLTDEAGVPVGQITVSRSTTVGEIAAQAEAFGLPDGESYAIYRVGTGPDGSEKTQRLAGGTRLGDVDLGDEEVLRLRFAASLKGA